MRFAPTMALLLVAVVPASAGGLKGFQGQFIGTQVAEKTADALAAVNLIDGGPLGELRAGGGVAWKRAQLRLSWRALIGPFKNLAGPELAFIVRL